MFFRTPGIPNACQPSRTRLHVSWMIIISRQPHRYHRSMPTSFLYFVRHPPIGMKSSKTGDVRRRISNSTPPKPLG